MAQNYLAKEIVCLKSNTSISHHHYFIRGSKKKEKSHHFFQAFFFYFQISTNRCLNIRHEMFIKYIFYSKCYIIELFFERFRYVRTSRGHFEKCLITPLLLVTDRVWVHPYVVKPFRFVRSIAFFKTDDDDWSRASRIGPFQSRVLCYGRERLRDYVVVTCISLVSLNCFNIVIHFQSLYQSSIFN